MKTKTFISRLCLICLSSIPYLAFTQPEDIPLGIGDFPPEMKVAKWIKGQPVKEFEKGHVYVIDFSFLKCGPCIQAIPHLNELALKYEGDATVISIFTRGDKIHDVETFVYEMGNKIKFRVAADGDQRMMESSWMQKADMWAYPTVFLIDKTGRIAWVEGKGDIKSLDNYVDQIIEGQFNPKTGHQNEK